MKKAILFLVAAVMILMTAACALADGSLYDVKPFKFQHMEDGLYRGVCPVYSAPYKDAYRANNGRASVSTDGTLVDIGGFSNGWLLVRYETNNGAYRVGWIPPKYVKGIRTSMTPHFSYIRQTADEEIDVSDNNKEPFNTSSYFAQLEPGDVYYILGKYNYKVAEQWYIEFEWEGCTARGFILAE